MMTAVAETNMALEAELTPTAAHPERKIRWIPKQSGPDGIRGVLAVLTKREHAVYVTIEFPCDGTGRAFRLKRVNGDAHDCFIATHGTEHVCDCEGFTSGASEKQLKRSMKASDGRAFATAGCRHLDALLCIRRLGWLEASVEQEEVEDVAVLDDACASCGEVNPDAMLKDGICSKCHGGDGGGTPSVEVAVGPDPLDLLPCPFCGGKAEITVLVPGGSHRWVRCTGTGCEVMASGGSNEAATRMWNRRVK